jgi:hypothetical protein
VMPCSPWRRTCVSTSTFTPDLRVVAQPRRGLVRGIIERQAIRRCTFASVRELMIKIRTFINGWKDRCHAFIWIRTADQIFKKANRQTTQVAVHK